MRPPPPRPVAEHINYYSVRMIIKSKVTKFNCSQSCVCCVSVSLSLSVTLSFGAVLIAAPKTSLGPVRRSVGDSAVDMLQSLSDDVN